jgi:hypothetical protein
MPEVRGLWDRLVRVVRVPVTVDVLFWTLLAVELLKRC